ncbi:MAG: FG-GAP-like repeat-containing protein [Balneolaceae bacterium]
MFRYSFISQVRTSLRIVLFLCIILSAGCTTSPDLEWNTDGQGYHWAEVKTGFFGNMGFEQLSSSKTNIDFVNRLTDEEIAENRHYLNGSGVAAGDINGDGFTDLYFASLTGSNKLYKNLGGMKFEDITEESGVGLEGYASTGAVFADVNGNGHLDLLVTSMSRENVLFINDGGGTFRKEEDSGLGRAGGSNTMALTDITGNGYPDLYITNYKEKSLKDLYTTRELDWNNVLNEPYNEQQQTGPYTLIPPFDQHYEIYMTDDNRLAGLAETGELDELYLNTGGKFEKVTDTREIFLDADGNPYGLQPDWGLAAKFQDLNGDGFQDLYVCNDFHTKDRIWMNQGEGIFKAADDWSIRNLSFACMGVDFSDINRDGELDIFTAEMLGTDHDQRLRQVGPDDPFPGQHRQTDSRPTYNRNSLYLKREDETYAEISYLSGVEATGWSWDATFMDIDLDGYEDLIVANGYLYHILDMDAQLNMVRKRRNMDEHFDEFIRDAPSLELQNQAFLNNGDLTFRELSTELGFKEADISHGMAVADLNNDGTLDLVTNRMNSEAGIYQNRTNAPRISIRLKGKAPNTQAAGAKVELYGAQVHQQKEVSIGGSYASGSDPLVVFAADPKNSDHQIVINWPDGTESIIENVKANRIYEIREAEITKNEEPDSPAGVMVSEQVEDVSTPIFEDISDQLNHIHHEDPFTDFAIQPLLPGSMGQLGPGITWLDLDEDGRDDLLISSGKGGELVIFKNREEGGFDRLALSPLTDLAPGDQTSILGWREDNYLRIVVGSSNYEQGSSRAPSVYLYKIEVTPGGPRIVETDSLPGIYSTTGTLAAADVTGNGYPDLFIGGRLKPGQYPADADSRLYLNENGNFRLDESNSRLFSGLGLVTGAVFSDFTRNRKPDLLISTEWGTLRLFENRDGRFTEITKQAGLDTFKGLWNGVATGDFTNNGYPDIVATNRGRNSSYQFDQDRPMRIYFDDFNQDSRMEILEAVVGAGGEYVPGRKLYHYESIPAIANQMRSHLQFSTTTLPELFDNQLHDIPYKEINTLEHMVFLNNGDGFVARPLPAEAQFSIAFHAGVADMDNDGFEDIFITQNFFGVPEQVMRMDAGRALWLKGDGTGNFHPVSGEQSGIKVYGEQRGAAFSDFNRDGRTDLSVSQNRFNTKLFLNRTETRGFRITLKGPPSNRDGIGSRIRLVYKDGKQGPVREVQAGAGYWSQNSFTQVIGASDDVEQIEVDWFDGSRQNVVVSGGQKDYVIQYQTKN